MAKKCPYCSNSLPDGLSMCFKCRSKTRMAQAGWIYALGEEGDNQFVKFGVTSTNVEQRISQLQVGNPRKLILLKSAFTRDMYLTESMLKVRLVESRTEGGSEWFKRSDARVEDAIATYFG